MRPRLRLLETCGQGRGRGAGGANVEEVVVYGGGVS